MELKQILGAIVAVIIICTVAIPIIDSMPPTAYKYAENEQYSTRIAFVDNPTIEIELTNANSREMKIGDATITYKSSFNIISQGFGIGAASVGENLYFFTQTGNTLLATGDKISITNGNWTFTPTSGSTQSGQIAWIMYPDETGDWAKFNSNAKISADSTIFVAGGAQTSGCAKGSVDGEFTTEWISPAGPTMTITLNKTPIENGLSYNVDCINGVSITNSTSDTSTTSNGFIYAPIKYKIESNTIVDTIVDIIPILLISAVVIWIASSFARRD